MTFNHQKCGIKAGLKERERDRERDRELDDYLTCAMKEEDAKRLARVLAQCPALAHLDLRGKSVFGAAGAKRLAGVLV